MKSRLPRSEVVRNYCYAIQGFFEALAFYLEGSLDEESLNKKMLEWERSEKEYSEKGFRTISHDGFFDAVKSGEWFGEGNSHDYGDLLKQKRDRGEDPVFYAAAFRDRFLPEVKEAIRNKKLYSEARQPFP